MAKKSRKKKISSTKEILFLAAGFILIFALFWTLDKLGIVTYDSISETVGLSDTAFITDSDTAIHFIDVGQGDCTLVASGGKYLLIDAGETDYGDTVCNYLKAQNIERLDYVIATHPHSDHIGGLVKVVSSYEIGMLIAPKVPDELTPTSKCYSDFLEAVQENGCGLTAAKAGDIYSLGNAEFEILAPLSDESEDLNNYSVVCMLSYGRDKVLFTGDASKDEENDILAAGYDIDADILKVGHHGSSSSSTKKFLEQVTPDYCIIMCGADNSYNHPNEKAVERLRKHTDLIYRTDLNGSVVCELDGKGGYKFTCSKGEE